MVLKEGLLAIIQEAFNILLPMKDLIKSIDDSMEEEWDRMWVIDGPAQKAARNSAHRMVPIWSGHLPAPLPPCILDLQ
jgi:hypothetical protein